MTDPAQFEIMNLSGGSWTLHRAFEGTQIFGGTGSGKTSGSGQEIGLKFLEAGMGGLVLCVKPDEPETWAKYASLTNRQDDIEFFGPVLSKETPKGFNFLEYEREQAINDARLSYPEESSDRQMAIASSLLTENLVNLFTNLMEVSQRGGGGGGSNDAYWQNACRQMLRNALDLLILSGEDLTFQNLHRLITSSPSSLEEANEESARILSKSGRTYCARCLAKIADFSDGHPREGDCLLLVNYWLREIPNLAPETRSIIVSFFTTVADPFLRGALSELFNPPSGTEELTPEDTYEGKIIVLNLPVKEFFELGQFAQVLYKFIWQRATERSFAKNKDRPPVFLWADEAQFFINSQDMLFQTTARSARVATVYLTQSISNYYAIMPGEKGRAQTDSLMGNFQTKVFHANTDAVTNQWAADLIGKAMRKRVSKTNSASTAPDSSNPTKASVLMGRSRNSQESVQFSQSESFEYQVPPLAFTKLKKGGPDHGNIVEGIIVQGGNLSNKGNIFQKREFTQDLFSKSDSASKRFSLRSLLR